jgi:5-methylcytosine-specific restriction enzyme B
MDPVPESRRTMRKKTALQIPGNRKASPKQTKGLVAKDQEPRQSAQEECALDNRSHRTFLELAQELKDALAERGFEAQDMVPIQSVMWVAGRRGYDMGVQALDENRQRALHHLLDEFASSYLASEEGLSHLKVYGELRETGRRNFEQVVEARDAGQDIVDLVLTKLLPNRDTPANRAQGAWIHIAPAVTTDIKTLSETAGWVKPEDWPQVTRSILELVERVAEDPASLDDACKRFLESGHNTGFQSGLLTPILNALHPDDLILVNNKSRAVINHFLGLSYQQTIQDYPHLNRAAHYLIDRIRPKLTEVLPDGASPLDGFDAFTHWLVAIKQYRFGKTQAWKVAVENLQSWEIWREARFLGLSEPAMGNASSIKKQQWEAERARILKENPATSGERLDQVWTLLHEVQEGDEILVTLGTEKALGIGIVVGSYEFLSEKEPQHRRPVRWQDTRTRTISEPGWRARFHALDPREVERIRKIKPNETVVGSGLFSPRTFELLLDLHKNPTVAFYNEHREDFRAHVETPLQSLLTGVAPLLPPMMREVLETEKGLFSRIPKNDFGKGGAWPFYWGAFFAGGGKRINSAQLFVSLDRNGLEYGFSLGEYAEDQRTRFLKNVAKSRDALIAALKPHIQGNALVFATRKDEHRDPDLRRGSNTLEGWLENVSGESISVRVSVDPKTAVSLSEADLKSQVLDAFQQLFPLILFGTSENPLPEIAEYIGGIDDVDLQPEYPLERCAQDTGFEVAKIRQWVRAIERKRQAVFYGPPGTGKTFMAEHIARHLVGGGDGFVDLVQFHPAYVYEDFIQGIRPITRPDGGLEYQMVPGRFLDFCRRAQNRSGTCVLIVDEINRANLSRVFGELMYLLEYRDKEIPLAGGGAFRIPANVRILGTMNTADRSIALVDHALRRRFAFLPLRPEYEVLRSFHADKGKSVDGLIDALRKVNQAIGEANYHVGITFFLHPELEDNLEAIWTMEIEPYLEEFFFDNGDTVDRLRWSKVQGGMGM